MNPIIEIVGGGDGSFGPLWKSEKFYKKIAHDMPEQLRAIEMGCHVGEYYQWPASVPIIELLEWFNQNGIDVIIRSCIHNTKYIK